MLRERATDHKPERTHRGWTLEETYGYHRGRDVQ
jgi:hypothetical protein